MKDTAKKPILVIMAAGMGSRFGGLKQIEAVGPAGEAILDYSLFDAHRAGFETVVFIIKHAIEDAFKSTVGARAEKAGLNVRYAYQELDILPEGFTVPEGRIKPWGTAHAILSAADAIDAPFAVINADDYYGRSAFKKIYDELSSASEDYCMVGFRLKNTLTENGTVSRGVCVTDNNALESVTEYTKIRSDCSFTEDDGKTWNALSPDTVVSMNLWGFRPDVFKYIEDGFVSFLKEKLNVPKSEYYLPSVVSSLIESGTKKVNVLVAEDKWYGVTYKEDKPAVVASIGELIDKGYYDGI